MSDITSWERSAANNNSAPPDGAPEGMAPSTVNNTMREMMAAVARNRRQYTGTDSGTDAYQFDGNGDLATGDVVDIDTGSANTTATPTLENTGGAPAGAQSIVDVDGNARIGMLAARPHRFQWNGTNYVVLDPALPAGTLLATATYLSSGTHTYTAGARKAKVWCTAAGGGGSGSDDSNDLSGSGGGAGGTSIEWITGFSGTETVTVGSGGSGGAAASAGSDGGNSSFGSFLSANGGGGAIKPATGDGGTGGLASDGDINITGGDGVANQRVAKSSGGNGGASYWGGGGSGGRSVANGNAGKARGSGGGGGGEGNAGGDKTGGDGADGLIYIEEYA